MRPPIIAAALVFVLLISAMTSALFCFRYLAGMRKLSHLQAQALAIQNKRQQVQALANEAVEYSRQNPAIDGILRDLGIKAMPTETTNQSDLSAPR